MLLLPRKVMNQNFMDIIVENLDDYALRKLGTLSWKRILWKFSFLINSNLFIVR